MRRPPPVERGHAQEYGFVLEDDHLEHVEIRSFVYEAGHQSDAAVSKGRNIGSATNSHRRVAPHETSQPQNVIAQQAPLMLQKISGFSVFHFMRKACIRPVLAGVLQATIMGCIRLTGHPANFFQLVLQGILAVALSVAVLIVVGLTVEERQRFFTIPMRSFLNKVKIA